MVQDVNHVKRIHLILVVKMDVLNVIVWVLVMNVLVSRNDTNKLSILIKKKIFSNFIFVLR